MVVTSSFPDYTNKSRTTTKKLKQKLDVSFTIKTLIELPCKTNTIDSVGCFGFNSRFLFEHRWPKALRRSKPTLV